MAKTLHLRSPQRDAADSMREGWEIHQSEIRHMFPPHHWSQSKWDEEAVVYVRQLMPGETNLNVIQIAKMLREG